MPGRSARNPRKASLVQREVAPPLGGDGGIEQKRVGKFRTTPQSAMRLTAPLTQGSLFDMQDARAKAKCIINYAQYIKYNR